MNHRTRLACLAVLATTPAAHAQFGHVPGAVAPAPDVPTVEREPTGLYQAQALHLLAQQHGLELADLEVLTATVSEYSLLQEEGYAYKVLDRSTDEPYGIEIDAGGRVLDPEALDALELDLQEQLFGKLEPELHELLQQLGPQDPVPVEIWLNDEGFVDHPRPLPSEQEDPGAIAQAAATQHAQRKAYIQQLRTAVVDALQNLSAPGVIPHDLVPVVSAELTGPEIDAIAALPMVASIERGSYFEQHMSVAAGNIAADKVWSEGYVGSGIKVGIVETDGGRVGTAAAYLPVTQDTTYSCWSGTHARHVACVLASTNPTFLGIANGASLYASGSCSGSQAQLEHQTEACVDWGARAVNHSYGGNTLGKLTSMDKFMDDIVQNSWVFQAISSGNDSYWVNTPGTAYNVVTVGNHNDKFTVAIGDDSINSGSSYANPSSKNGDREKPEVTAPGTNIKVDATGSTVLEGTGTSLSSPMVVGAAALLMGKDADLEIWPESLKAILMATAWNNVHGSSDLSDRDGAGGIRCKRAYNVVDGSKGGWDGRSYGCSTSSTLDLDSIHLEAGKRCRVVIAWDQNKSYGKYKKRPSADLDLYLRRSGSTVRSSTSYDNTYEMIDFTPSTTGSYTIRVKQYRCNKTPKYLGWAWHQEG